MFSSVGTFLYRNLAGLKSVKPSYSSAWRKVDTGYTLDVTIPMGATATIVLPKLQMANPAVSESGKVLGTNAQVEIGSGKYHFQVKERDQ